MELINTTVAHHRDLRHSLPYQSSLRIYPERSRRINFPSELLPTTDLLDHLVQEKGLVRVEFVLLYKHI